MTAQNGAARRVAHDWLAAKSFSIGVLAEHTFGDDDFTVYAAPFAYWIDRGKFALAPGISYGDSGTESHLRVAAVYAFEAGARKISPQLFGDGEEVLIPGVVFGKGF